MSTSMGPDDGGMTGVVSGPGTCPPSAGNPGSTTGPGAGKVSAPAHRWSPEASARATRTRGNPARRRPARRATATAEKATRKRGQPGPRPRRRDPTATRKRATRMREPPWRGTRTRASPWRETGEAGDSVAGDSAGGWRGPHHRWRGRATRQRATRTASRRPAAPAHRWQGPAYRRAVRLSRGGRLLFGGGGLHLGGRRRDRPVIGSCDPSECPGRQQQHQRTGQHEPPPQGDPGTSQVLRPCHYKRLRGPRALLTGTRGKLNFELYDSRCRHRAPTRKSGGTPRHVAKQTTFLKTQSTNR